MGPTLTKIEQEAVRPYLAKTIEGAVAWDRGRTALHEFMIRQTRKADIILFARMANVSTIERPESTPFDVLIPAYVISELKTAFIMGFCHPDVTGHDDDATNGHFYAVQDPAVCPGRRMAADRQSTEFEFSLRTIEAFRFVSVISIFC
jgi:hypothetical protein